MEWWTFLGPGSWAWIILPSNKNRHGKRDIYLRERVKQNPRGQWGSPSGILSWEYQLLDKSNQWLWPLMNSGVLSLHLSSGGMLTSVSPALPEGKLYRSSYPIKWIGCQQTKENYDCAWGHSEGKTSQLLPQYLCRLPLKNAYDIGKTDGDYNKLFVFTIY